MPGFTGNGSVDPFPAPAYVMTEFADFISSLVDQGKTDGIQYSTTIGTSIRRWADEETCTLYKNYIDVHYMAAFEIPTEGQTYIVEDLDV